MSDMHEEINDNNIQLSTFASYLFHKQIVPIQHKQSASI